MRARAFRNTAVAGALLVLLAGCKTELNSGLTETAANEEIALLLRQGVPAARSADAKSGSYAVLVEKARFADAVDLLRAHGLPRAHYDTIPEIFKGGGLVASPVEERARLVYATGEELSRTIAEIDGVLSARVHIVLPDEDPLRQNAPPASASVFVRYKDGSRVDRLVPQIKMLVSDGVAGLAYDRVSVIMVPAALPADAAAPAPDLVQIAGIWVEASSASTVRLMLALSGGVLAALAAAGGWFAWQRRRHLARLPIGRLLTR